MRFKSARQPLCCNCGKPIAKHTTTVMFGRQENIPGRGYLCAKPKDRAEAQRHVNQQITSTRRSADGSWLLSVHVWDGETYADEFFCTNRCAIFYARNMARVQTHGRRKFA